MMKKNVLFWVSLFVFFAVSVDARIGYNISKKNILKPTPILVEKEYKIESTEEKEIQKTFAADNEVKNSTDDEIENIENAVENLSESKSEDEVKNSTDDELENVEKVVENLSDDKSEDVKKSRLERRREEIVKERERKKEERMKKKRENESVFQKELREKAEERAKRRASKRTKKRDLESKI